MINRYQQLTLEDHHEQYHQGFVSYLRLAAILQMIDYIVREHGLSSEQAYILASVAVDLRVGQVVDVPNYVVTAVLNKGVFFD